MREEGKNNSLSCVFSWQYYYCTE